MKDRLAPRILAAACFLLPLSPPPDASAQNKAPAAPHARAVYRLGTLAGHPGTLTVQPQEVSKSVPGFEGNTVIHLAFVIDNRGDDELQFRASELRLDWWNESELPERNLRPTAVRGTTEVEAGTTEVIDAYFELDLGVPPDPVDIDSFRTRWEIETDSFTRMRYQTVFTAYVADGRRSFHYTPRYDPFIRLRPFSEAQLPLHHGPFHRGRPAGAETTRSVRSETQGVPIRRGDGRTDNMR